MRLATFNVNSIHARLDYVSHWLRERQPDIACLQELKVDDDHFPFEALKELGYHASIHAQKQWNGVAILSREPAEIKTVGLLGQDSLGARLLTASVSGLEVTSVYVPNGKNLEHADYERKLAFMQALTDYVAAGASERRVVAGDFNIVPTDLDTYDAVAMRDAMFHSPRERAALQAFEASGLHDLYRKHHPDTCAFSWWDYRGGSFYKNRGLRIDMIYASNDLVERCADCTIDRDYRKKKDGLTASDHAPVMAEFNL